MYYDIMTKIKKPNNKLSVSEMMDVTAYKAKSSCWVNNALHEIVLVEGGDECIGMGKGDIVGNELVIISFIISVFII